MTIKKELADIVRELERAKLNLDDDPDSTESLISRAIRQLKDIIRRTKD